VDLGSTATGSTFVAPAERLRGSDFISDASFAVLE